MTPLPSSRFEMPRWLKVALVITFGTNVVAVLTCGALLYSNSKIDTHQGENISTLIASQHADQLAACERGNDARVAEVGNLESDLISLRSDRKLLEAVQAATEPSPVYATAIEAKNRAIRRKHKAIHETIEAQAPVAIEKGSPVVDCVNKAYSLHDDQQDQSSQGGAR